MFDSLNLTALERDALNRELLYLLERHGQPAALADLFAGLEPRWARDAAERLLAEGKVREVGGRLELAGAGRAAPRKAAG